MQASTSSGAATYKIDVSASPSAAVSVVLSMTMITHCSLLADAPDALTITATAVTPSWPAIRNEVVVQQMIAAVVLVSSGFPAGFIADGCGSALLTVGLGTDYVPLASVTHLSPADTSNSADNTFETGHTLPVLVDKYSGCFFLSLGSNLPVPSVYDDSPPTPGTVNALANVVAGFA